MTRYTFDGTPIPLTPEEIEEWQQQQQNQPQRDFSDSDRIDAWEAAIKEGLKL